MAFFNSHIIECEACVIGGGVSGLTAANHLAQSFLNEDDAKHNQKTIILLESSSCLGGRIMSKKWNVINTNNDSLNATEKEITIDVGAAYLHGIHSNTNASFIEFLHNECGVKFDQYTDIHSVYPTATHFIHPLIKQNCNVLSAPIYYEKHNKCYYLNDVNNTPPFMQQMDALFEELQSNTNIDSLPADDLSFFEWLKACELQSTLSNDEVKDAINYAQLMYATEECADIKHLGLRQFVKSCKEWKFGEGSLHLNGQYFKLIRYFERKFNEYKNIVRVLLNTEVYKIQYINSDSTHVMISTNNPKVPMIRCNYCICSVPITVLQSNKIAFDPPLTLQKQESITKIHAGNGAKIYLQFNHKFWDSQTSVIYVADCEFVSELIFSRYKTNGDEKDVFIVCGLSFAKQWQIFRKYSEQQIVNHLTNLLFKIFKLDINNAKYKHIKCIKSLIYNWNAVRNINCTYSSPKTNSEQCKKILAEPIHNKIFFCGEAVSDSFPAIQNVMNHASNVVTKILANYHE